MDRLSRHYHQLVGLNEDWAIGDVDLNVAAQKLTLQLEFVGDQLQCPECGTGCSKKDHAPERSWRHLDAMQFQTILVARIPRSFCNECGVKTIAVPWAEKYSRFTLMFEAFAIEVLHASRSIQSAALLLGIDWSTAQTSKITLQKGKFLIAVKGNQPTLFETIKSFFDDHWEDGDWSKGRCHRHHTSEQTGSRQDDRYYYVAPIPRREEVFDHWPSVKAIGMVIRVQQEGDEVTEDVRYYILSDDLTGKDFARAVRKHWSIENNCHWQLDVLFHEDASRVRERTLTNNLSWLRRVAISLLKHHPSTDSLKGKRQSAGWNEQFLAETLQFTH